MAFLVFEGLDGSGKSTLIKNLNEHLLKVNIQTVLTREPGGSPLGEELRELILKNQNQPPCPRAELLMYEASRAQHVHYKIKPGLESGKWVLCDRFIASSVAFQSGGREISLDQTQWLNDFATFGLKPDLTVLLDITYQGSQKRLKNSNRNKKDRIENEAESFHQRVRESYLSQAKSNKSWVVLDAELSEEELFNELISEMTTRGFLS